MKHLQPRLICGVLAGAAFFSVCASAQTVPAQTVAGLKAEVAALRLLLEEQRKHFQQQLRQMEAKINDLAAKQAATPAPAHRADGAGAPDDLAGALERLVSLAQAPPGSRLDTMAGVSLQSFNPDISVIVDAYYHNDDTSQGIEHTLERMAGFGHSHGDDHGHEHAQVEDGVNLRHLELYFSGDVDPYFDAWAIAAVSESSAEMEEAVMRTTSLPGGLQLQAGKFFSNFGRINAQHSHEWDFVDQPLIYKLTLGDHGLNEKGLQLSWLAPTPFQLLGGLEAFHGDNELLCHHLGGDELPRQEGPRLWVGWLKCAPNLPGAHGLQVGLFGAQGVHQEAHDGNDDGNDDHWLDGRNAFWGGDFVYKYDDAREHGHGDLTVQGEYMRRTKHLEVERHDLNAAMVGRDRIDRQDGLYLQATYGFLPRWRTGLRWEHVGLINKSQLPDGTRPGFGDSFRVAAMLDFTPTEFSRLRLQIARGRYELEDEPEDVWQAFLQLMISLGAHGAHKF